MAKAVKLPKGVEAFDFGTTGTKGGAKYPWNEWFNGDLLEIERSVPADSPTALNDKGTIVEYAPNGKRDYDVPTNAMFPKTKTAARVRYMVCQMSRVDAKGRKLVDSIIIQARDMTPEERIAEDAQRVLDKMRAAMKVGDKVIVHATGTSGTIAALNGSKVDITRDDGSTDKTTGYDRSDLTLAK